MTNDSRTAEKVLSRNHRGHKFQPIYLFLLVRCFPKTLASLKTFSRWGQNGLIDETEKEMKIASNLQPDMVLLNFATAITRVSNRRKHVPLRKNTQEK